MKTKQAAAFALAAIMLALMCSCGYASHYRAVAFVHSNTRTEAYMSFSSFEGTMVFKLKCDVQGGTVNYTANLESGSAKVYCDCGNGKTGLFAIGAGGDITSFGGEPEKGATVYVIVETDGKCENGSFSFTLDYPMLTGKIEN